MSKTRQKSLGLTSLTLTAGLSMPAVAQVPAVAPESPESQLTIPNIMRGPELVGTAPSQLAWSLDGGTLYFVWKRAEEEREGLYRVDRSGRNLERLPDLEARLVAPTLRAAVSEDRSWAAFARDGDLYLLEVRSGRERLLVSVPGRIASVRISPDGDAVYFMMGNNLYRVEPRQGTVSQLTDIRRGSEPQEEKPPEGQRKYLVDENRDLFRVFAEDSLRRARNWPPPPDTAAIDTPQAFYVRRGQRLGGYWVSPDGGRMAFSLSKEPEEARLAWVPDYVTEEGYTAQAPRRRSYVGDEQGSGRLGFMDLSTGSVVWVEHGLEDQVVNLQFRGWSKRGDRILAAGTSEDFQDRWIFVVDADSGAAKMVDHLHDDAWVGGPGFASAGWMPDGDHIWFLSEESGFAHLYTVAVGGGEPTPLTTGPWEVIRAELSPDEKEWYLETSESSPHERGFYHMNLDGSDRRLITTHGTLHGSGRFGGPIAVAPDGKLLALLYSSAAHPPELFLQENRAGAKAVQVTESTSAEFRSYDWREPEIVYFTARDGVEVPARLYRPEQPNDAAVIFVHGAGYLQNVHRWWSSYYREYMFHNLLAERGYTVLDIDYRGSAGYGRDWRTAIRKGMGGKDLSDQVDGARFLVDSLGIDSQRIGIYGGSYGGFITLMAMFTEPATFAAGAALRPVTDWAYYNHWYTSRILGLPQEDVEAYRRSSPIYHADGLTGALLICHGMIDQNVHFQDTVRLAERLMELGKENWEVAIYPKEDHGFTHSWAWIDEYRRIYRLFEAHLGGTGSSTVRVETSGKAPERG